MTHQRKLVMEMTPEPPA